MEPWQSWGIVGIVGAGAYLYYSQSGKPKRARGRAPFVADQNQARNAKLRDDSKGLRKRGDASGASDQITSEVADVSSTSVSKSAKDRVIKRKGQTGQPSHLGQSSGVDVNPEVVVDTADAEDEEMDNKEFARQLSEVKAGTSLNKPVNGNQSRKTKKQGKRNELQPHPVNGGVVTTNGVASGMSTASSTTGADADDDLSPAISPALGATESTKTTGDVSDMLEPSTKGPSVFRLTESAQSQTARQPKTQKKAEEPETKKQRQNRKKNEEKKLAREQAEKERRVLLEKQLRTAREAEGRPAKNGLGLSQAPVSNAWTKSGDDTTAPTSSSASDGHGALLDTFDETKSSAEHGNGTKDTVWERELPSEEEQMRILNEMVSNDGWNTVEKSGKAKKKAGKMAEGEDRPANTHGSRVAEKKKSTSDIKSNGNRDTHSSSGVDGPESGSTHNTVSYQSKPKADPAVWNRSNIHNHPDYDPEYPYALTGHPDDSDWAVV